jgi:hypothetical protein
MVVYKIVYMKGEEEGQFLCILGGSRKQPDVF